METGIPDNSFSMFLYSPGDIVFIKGHEGELYYVLGSEFYLNSMYHKFTDSDRNPEFHQYVVMNKNTHMTCVVPACDMIMHEKVGIPYHILTAYYSRFIKKSEA